MPKRAGRGPVRFCAILLLLAISVPAVVAAQPLRIRYAVWVGYGPLFLAQQRGYFAAEGVEVELVRVEDPGESFRAMAGGKLDGVVSTIDTLVLHARSGRDAQCVLALDDSAGGDGIVARKEIRAVADLRGKRVAVQLGSVSQFFLNVLLREAGLSERDVVLVNQTPGEAGSAFVAGRVDAAVTWEPWLSKGKTAPHGHLLVDSSRTPGLITDVLAFRGDVVERRAREIRGVASAWHRAVEDWERNPREANGIMARAVGDWLRDPRVFADVLSGVRFYDRAANARFFGTAERPGPLYRVVQHAQDVWGGLGKLQGQLAPKDLVSHAFVK